MYTRKFQIQDKINFLFKFLATKESEEDMKKHEKEKELEEQTAFSLHSEDFPPLPSESSEFQDFDLD